jgi:serine protease Do
MNAAAAYADRVGIELADLADRIRPSMVRIQAEGAGVGSGTIWSEDGLIVTCAHVAERGNLFVSTHDQRILPARVVGVEHKVDIALLEVSTAEFRPIPRGDLSLARRGELVFAMGHPWGSEDGFTIGVLIGLELGVPRPGTRGQEWLAASLHLRPGHSGGPLFDSRGRLLGLNTLMQGPDVGVAVPVSTAERAVRQILPVRS